MTNWFKWLRSRSWGVDDDWDDDTDDDSGDSPSFADVTTTPLKIAFSLHDEKDRFGPRLRMGVGGGITLSLNIAAVDKHIKELQEYRRLMGLMAGEKLKDELDAEIVE